MRGPAGRSDEHSQFRLLAERRFGPFFGVQFLGAFNDNVFKQALVILITFHAAGFAGLAPEVMVNLAGGLFILPFFLFSATAGQLADKYDKARIIRLVKVLEIAIMVIAAAGFVRHDVVLLLAALCLLGLHSTLFGPVKYAILPQALQEHELVGGNALVETGTSLAILAGTILGGVLIALPSGPGLLVPAVTIAVAVARLRGEPLRARARRRRSPTSRSTGIRSPRPGATSSSPAATARCSWRSSACRGSGSSARC